MIDLDTLLTKDQEVKSTRQQIIETKLARRRIMERMTKPSKPVELNVLLAELNSQAPIDPDLPNRLENLITERKELAYKLVHEISNLLGFDPPWGPIKINNHAVACDSNLPSSLMIDGRYVLTD